MNEGSPSAPSAVAGLPDDDPQRQLGVARPDTDRNLCCLAIAGGVYTVMLTGKQTNGRYCLIEMRVPAGGGPPPHRHDFEEMFAVVEGEIEFTFRGEKTVIRAGEAVNIPANAPHFFRNTSGQPSKMLCVCTPAGQEEFFEAIGERLVDRHATPPVLTDEQRRAKAQKVAELAPRFRTEMLKP